MNFVGLPPLFPRKNRKIGILAGSFNPAHEGHIHLSHEARKALQLDEVWWLVTPCSPMKSPKDMMDYDKRFNQAKEVTKSIRFIHCYDIEYRKDFRFSIELVWWLVTTYHGIHFTWLMGMDNLLYLHKWKRYQALLGLMPVAVIDRGGIKYQAVRSRAMCRYANRIQLFFGRKSPISATRIRNLWNFNKI